MFAQLKPQIDALVTMAAQGSDAGGAADLLFDQMILELPDEMYDKIYQIVSGPNFITQAAVFNPGVRAHEAWFGTFRTQVLARYDQEETAAREAPTPAASI